MVKKNGNLQPYNQINKAIPHEFNDAGWWFGTFFIFPYIYWE